MDARSEASTAHWAGRVRIVGMKLFEGTPEGMAAVKEKVFGEIPEGALGARVHASIDGTVEAVDGNIVIVQ